MLRPMNSSPALMGWAFFFFKSLISYLSRHGSVAEALSGGQFVGLIYWGFGVLRCRGLWGSGFCGLYVLGWEVPLKLTQTHAQIGMRT